MSSVWCMYVCSAREIRNDPDSRLYVDPDL